MGKKLYQPTEDGGIQFKTERRIGDVRIPNYIYDLWMPLLGSDVIGVYAVLCRLERGDGVKGITMQTLANACRMGKARFMGILETLDKCDFIDVKKPEGQARLWHYTTEITVKDPAQELSKETIEEYRPARGYEPLTPWLIADDTEVPNGTSGETEQYDDKVPNSTTSVESSILHPLVVEERSCADAQPPQDAQEDQEPQPSPPESKTKSNGRARTAQDDMFDLCAYVLYRVKPDKQAGMSDGAKANTGRTAARLLRMGATEDLVRAWFKWWQNVPTDWNWQGKKKKPLPSDLSDSWPSFIEYHETWQAYRASQQAQPEYPPLPTAPEPVTQLPTREYSEEEKQAALSVFLGAPRVNA